MIKLESMGLITVTPRYGTQVSRIDINEIRCAFEVKIKLEGLAGAVAAKRITEEKTKDKKVIEKAKSLEREEDHSFIKDRRILPGRFGSGNQGPWSISACLRSSA